MKNIIIAILVAIILILGFLFFTQKKSNVNYEPWPETEPAIVRPTTTNNNSYPVQNNPAPINPAPTNNNEQEQHEYSNSGYDFFVDLSGRVVMQKTAVGIARQMFYFDKPNGEREFIVSVFTSAQWEQYWNSLSTTFDYVGTVTQDGVTFNYYTKPALDPGINDPQTLHYYIAQHNGFYYEIYTTNPSYLNSFGFL